ncbi:MAG: hypothetical protein R3C45_02480 [Phycisphaerales bacterium]
MSDRLEQLHKLHAADPADADVTYMIAMEHVRSRGLPRHHQMARHDPRAQNPDYHYAYFQKAKAQSQMGDDDAATATLKLGIEKAQQAGDGKAVSELGDLLAEIQG